MLEKLNRFCALAKLFCRLIVVYINPRSTLFFNPIIIDIWNEARRINRASQVGEATFVAAPPTDNEEELMVRIFFVRLFH